MCVRKFCFDTRQVVHRVPLVVGKAAVVRWRLKPSGQRILLLAIAEKPWRHTVSLHQGQDLACTCVWRTSYFSLLMGVVVGTCSALWLTRVQNITRSYEALSNPRRTALIFCPVTWHGHYDTLTTARLAPIETSECQTVSRQQKTFGRRREARGHRTQNSIVTR